MCAKCECTTVCISVVLDGFQNALTFIIHLNTKPLWRGEMTILMAEGHDRKVMMGSDGLGPNPSVAVTSDKSVGLLCASFFSTVK